MKEKLTPQSVALALASTGCLSLSLGAAWVYPPAGLIVFGLLLLGSLWVDF
jgi:hypothetical protein